MNQDTSKGTTILVMLLALVFILGAASGFALGRYSALKKPLIAGEHYISKP